MKLPIGESHWFMKTYLTHRTWSGSSFCGDDHNGSTMFSVSHFRTHVLISLKVSSIEEQILPSKIDCFGTGLIQPISSCARNVAARSSWCCNRVESAITHETKPTFISGIIREHRTHMRRMYMFLRVLPMKCFTCVISYMCIDINKNTPGDCIFITV